MDVAHGNPEIGREGSPGSPAPEPPALDRAICERARLARDARFDGRFFVGVLSTGIYCRPICPVQPPRPDHVRFFRSAAAAEEAGLRPCLRCRPECAPGSPAWLGTGATVRRALRLIEEGALDDDTVDRLAGRLGIGERHLRRLFEQWVGASPVQVARSRRLHLAKRLVCDSDLPMADVALAAGFGSVRRFNDAVRSAWGRTPTELRRGTRPRSRRSSEKGAGEVARARPLELQLSFREPYSWDGLLGFLAPRATAGVETVDGGIYRRSVEVDGEPGWIEATRSPVPGALEVRVTLADPRALLRVAERLRGLFDLYADPEEIGRHLARDPRLASLLRRFPGTRIPGAWDGFELAVRAVLGQQVTVKAATTLAGRLVERYGRPLPTALRQPGLERLFPRPHDLVDADPGALGMPGGRARAIVALARAAADGELDLEPTADPQSFERRLLALPGIGPWTASYVALRLLRDPDALPDSDLVLRQRLARSGERLASPRQVRERSEAWRPWRAYGAMLLWREAMGESGPKSNRTSTDGPSARSSDPENRDRGALP